MCGARLGAALAGRVWLVLAGEAIAHLLGSGIVKYGLISSAAQDVARIANLGSGSAAINHEVTGFECLEVKGHDSRVGVEALASLLISYTLVRCCQP